MNFNGSTFRICGAGAAGAGTFCPEPEPECFPGVGAVKIFTASLVYSTKTIQLFRQSIFRQTDNIQTDKTIHFSSYIPMFG